jgi:hypothetical protein
MHKSATRPAIRTTRRITNPTVDRCGTTRAAPKGLRTLRTTQGTLSLIRTILQKGTGLIGAPSHQPGATTIVGSAAPSTTRQRRRRPRDRSRSIGRVQEGPEGNLASWTAGCRISTLPNITCTVRLSKGSTRRNTSTARRTFGTPLSLTATRSRSLHTPRCKPSQHAQQKIRMWVWVYVVSCSKSSGPTRNRTSGMS